MNGFDYLSENGRATATLNEPHPNLSYISVFITHFFNTPAENYGILKKLYLDLGLSMRQIVAVTDSVWPKTSILDAIKLHDLGKDQGAQMLRVKYGEMLVKGQIVSNLKEQKIIKLIMKLHNDGQSFRKIAKHLNDKKIKSKKGGQWDKSVVTSIVCRQREEKK